MLDAGSLQIFANPWKFASQPWQKNFKKCLFIFLVKWVYHKLYIFQFQIFDTNWPSLLYISYMLSVSSILSISSMLSVSSVLTVSSVLSIPAGWAGEQADRTGWEQQWVQQPPGLQDWEPGDQDWRDTNREHQCPQAGSHENPPCGFLKSPTFDFA